MTSNAVAESESPGGKSSYAITRWLFIRLMSIVYIAAFGSVAEQISGLYGSQGILPMAAAFPQHKALDAGLMFNYPTVFWWNTSDSFLSIVPIVGLFAALIAGLGILVGPLLLVSWFLYLSIVTAGQDFMSFQWDILLLETGFLTLFFSSWRVFDCSWIPLKERWNIPSSLIDDSKPSHIVVCLLRWLLFRLMFSSGVVKLESGDEAWSNLTAMSYHYFTQPLPTPLGYFADHLPSWFQSFSTAAVFFLEIFVPLLILAPRKIRHVAAILLIFLQVLIILTGNYCYFNLLTIALCLPLFDDKTFLAVSPARLKEYLQVIGTAREASRLRLVLLIPVAITIGLASTVSLPVLSDLASNFHLVGRYGLFAVMTTTRPEIVVEASEDGIEWKEYVFKYKPGPLNRPPPIVAPAQPRLDWQLWFAALSGELRDRWFIEFVERLAVRSKPVMEMLEKDPLEGRRPKYIRASLYDYKFTDIATLVSTGNWWRRKYLKPYMHTAKVD